MHPSVVILVFAVSFFASARGFGADPPNVCWRNSYVRGIGATPSTCQDGQELQTGLCYQDCKDGYTGNGPVCWQNCPDGYDDTGAFCTRPPSTYYECPWYDVCGLTFAKGCLGPCDPGYDMVLCSCYRPMDTIAKQSYGRGSGVLPGCPATQQESAGLCYDPCKDQYLGSGPVCWQNSSGDPNFPVQCSPFAYGHTQADCDNLRELLKQAGFKTPICLAELAVYLVTGQLVGPKTCKDVIMQIVPELAKTTVCGQ